MSSVKRRHGDSTSRRRHVQVIEAIASKHYLQVTEDHFAKAVQNPVQQAHAPSRTDGQETTKAPDTQGLMRNRATTGDVVPEAQVAGTGFQRRPFPLGNSHILTTGAAKSGASDAANQVVDAELNEVIDAWPELPAAIKSGIMAMVRVGRGE